MCVCVNMCMWCWSMHMFIHAYPHITHPHTQSPSSNSFGCLELQDSFRKRAINYRALLQKMPSKEKASYASLSPFNKFLWNPEIAGFFRKRAINYRALLQKMTYKNKASYASLSSCMWCLPMYMCMQAYAHITHTHTTHTQLLYHIRTHTHTHHPPFFLSRMNESMSCINESCHI